MPEDYPIHPIALCWPALDEADLNALAESIKSQGLLSPITRYEGQILDGRSRYTACKIAGVEPRFVDYEGTDPVGFCQAQNDARRHLTTKQKGWVASELAKLQTGQHATKRPTIESVLAPATGPVEVSDGPSRSIPAIAERFKISPNTIKRAKTIREKGIPELIDAVWKSDSVSLEKGAQIARLPPEEQRTALASETTAPEENDAMPEPKIEQPTPSQPAVAMTECPRCERCALLTDHQIEVARSSPREAEPPAVTVEVSIKPAPASDPESDELARLLADLSD